jgi:D-alanyl-D-alanine dipeptidase
MELVDVLEYGFFIDLTEGKRYSDANTIFINKPVVEALVQAKKTLPSFYNFLIKDGFRTLETQKKIVEVTEKELRKSHPENWAELLDVYTGGYKDLQQTTISFMNHRSGNTVDITLTKDDKEIDLGGVVLNERDELDYFESIIPKNDTDEDIRDNRRILKGALTDANFVAYPLEWWHWGYSGNNTSRK